MNSVCDKFSRYYPEYWGSADYTGTLYVLIPVPKTSPEFVKVTRQFPWPVRTVSRIQNPLAYLRYCLQGEYLLHQIQKVSTSGVQVTQQDLQEYQVYHPVSQADVESAIQHNCDKRHYTNPQGNFFINTSILPIRNDNVVIILKKRGNISQITYTKNHYPMYLLTF